MIVITGRGTGKFESASGRPEPKWRAQQLAEAGGVKGLGLDSKHVGGFQSWHPSLPGPRRLLGGKEAHAARLTFPVIRDPLNIAPSSVQLSSALSSSGPPANSLRGFVYSPCRNILTRSSGLQRPSGQFESYLLQEAGLDGSSPEGGSLLPVFKTVCTPQCVRATSCFMPSPTFLCNYILSFLRWSGERLLCL